MTDDSYTAVALVVDRSGSMTSIAAESQNAINAFITEQAQAPGKRAVFLAQFDHQYEVVRPLTPADAVIPYSLEPRGMTALHDAIGKTVIDFGTELAALDEADRPGHVVVAIMTDGLENASQEFNAASVKKLITEQEQKYGWHFLYMGANQDAVLVGEQMGIRANSSISYAASSVGTRSVINSMGGYVATASSGLTPAVTFEDREQAMEE